MSEVLGGIALGNPKFFTISPYSDSKCAFGLGLKIKMISLFNLFLLLFLSFIVLFDAIYEPYCTISTNFYLYL